MIQILNDKANFIVIEPEVVTEFQKVMTLLDPKDYPNVKQGDVYDSKTGTFSTPEVIVSEESVTLKSVMAKLAEIETKTDGIKEKTDTISAIKA
jgi:hypothetical protein